MIIEYRVSHPGGDIVPGPRELRVPFRITPVECHPSLTLGDYFSAVESALLRGGGKDLLSLISSGWEQDLTLGDIGRIVVCSEKHGGLYHVARVEIFPEPDALVSQGPAPSLKLAVSTALSPQAKIALAREFDVLNLLNEGLALPYLPAVHFKSEAEFPSKAGKGHFAMLVSEWLEGYHEWHLSEGQGSKGQCLSIWEQKRGPRAATPREAREIFRQAAAILTSFYDTRSFRRIHPWHHGAGDFVVKTGGRAINVKLTTARDYRPFMAASSETPLHPLMALVYFFLDLTIRMRLDKLDGVGPVAWAGEEALGATMEGFFDALHRMKGAGRYPLGEVREVQVLLRGFDGKELKGLFQPLLRLYEKDSPEDLQTIRRHLDDHGKALYRTIQSFH